MEPLIPKHGGYRELKTFQLARLIFDITQRFCERFIDPKSRTKDQMVQAARSGVQNIAEGSQASGTSKKTELKLTNVARASLEELKLDYEDFLRQRQLPLWDFKDPRRQEVIDGRFSNADQFAVWVKKQKGDFSEIAANGLLVLLKVACTLLDRQIAAQAKAFQNEGGFTERLYRVRKEAQKIKIRYYMSLQVKLSAAAFQQQILTFKPSEPSKITKQFLDRIDRLNIKFDSENKVIKAEKYDEWQKVGKVLAEKWQADTHQLQIIQVKLASLKYRLRVRDEIDGQLKKSLLDLIVPWKKTHPYPLEALIITRDDVKKITELCRYSEFAKHLLKDEKFRDEIFTLIIRDYCPIEVVVCFYGLFLNEFKRSGNEEYYMTSRVGYFKHAPQEILRIVNRALDANRKLLDLQIQVEWEYISLCKPSEKEKAIWQRVKAEFTKIKDFPAELEFHERGGIRFIRPQRVPFELVDLRNPGSYKNLWSVRFPDEDFKKRYGKTIPENHFVFCVDAACKPTEKGRRRNLTDAHGYWRLFIRTDNGELRMWTIGKYSDHFPQKLGEMIAFPGKTNKAEQTTPDPNEFLPRVHGSVPFFIPMEYLEPFMQYVASQLNLLKFQWPNDSCSGDAQTKANQLGSMIGLGMPDFFRQYVVDVHMPPFYAIIFKPIKFLPGFLHDPILHGISLFVGAKRELILKDGDNEQKHSLYGGEYTINGHKLSNPVKLIEGIEKKLFDGVIYYGYDTSDKLEEINS